MQSTAESIHCSQCESLSPPNAVYCSSCGACLPSSELEQAIQGEVPPPPPPPVPGGNVLLWNPTVAASWSLIFSPAFGAFLHAKNWSALGQPDLMKRNYIWATVSIVVLFLLAFSHKTLWLVRIVQIGSTIAWYFYLGREEVAIVDQRYGSSFQHKKWLAPLLIAFAISFVHKFIMAYVQHEYDVNPYGQIDDYFER